MARTSRKQIDHVAQVPLETIWNTCVYGRLSEEDERKKESDSIGNQISMLERYIAERPYLKLISVFKDVNQTGTNFDRPGFNEMMDAIKGGKINCIVVKDLSRFGRNYIETGTYLDKILPFFNVRFISVNDGYDSLNASSQDDGYAVPLKNLIHDVYARDISKKIKSGLAVKRSRGEFTGCVAAYGYQKSANGKLVIDEETAPVVRDIFKWARNGMGDMRIVQKLNELGIPSPSQYRYEKGILKSDRYANMRYWYKSAVRRILINPVYLGHMVQGKTKSDLWGKGGCVELPQDQWVEIKNTHEPLVDEEIFLAVRCIKQERESCERKKVEPQRSNILKGLVFCGDCKRSMKWRKMPKSKGSALYYFSCATYEDIAKNDCIRKRMDEPDLLSILYTAIRKQIDLAVDIDRMVSKLNAKEGFCQQQSEVDTEISETEKKLSRLSMLRSSLYEDYQEKLLDEAEYLFTKAKYEKDVTFLRSRLDELSMQKHRLDTMLTPQNPWLAALKKFKKNKAITGEMISQLIERVEIFSDQSISICFRYRDEFESLLGFIEAESEVRVS
ncbi:recombinase family protein [Kineothrix sp. MB12-C1]|uniref:recombinase family protein n=1 Tax=Kineothrix sp. MB12-C1 TaxID=3070215 RepID=UPI0027D25869|nr:recombinase family protein [Kineothrix sp. MB12-C1]WMC93553.1 recombinase family protein [Kineothrix sp. MB12-C1]